MQCAWGQGPTCPTPITALRCMTTNASCLFYVPVWPRGPWHILSPLPVSILSPNTRPHTISITSSLILSSRPCLYLLNSFFPLDFQAKTAYISHSPVRAICPTHLILIFHPNNIWLRWELRSSSLCSFLQPPISTFCLGPNILFRYLLLT
jgi:hypothetical protein